MQQKEKTTDDMVRDLWHWAFGNGRPGVEQRLQKLEANDSLQATREDIGCTEDRIEVRMHQLSDRIDHMRRDMNIHEVIKLAIVVAAVVAATQGIFTGV